MCGIAGYIGKKEINNLKIENILKNLNHRGPDFQSFVRRKLSNNLNLYFFHSRLSIVDIFHRSNQPMEDKNGIIVFNAFTN